MASKLHHYNSHSKPQLKFVIEPETRKRFRYESEGGSHGALLGKQKDKGKQSYPSVKLEGYHGKKQVFIKVSLFTEDKKEHVFEFRGNLRYIKEYVQEDNIATFTNLKIWSKKKHEIEELLMNRKLSNIKDGISAPVRDHFVKTYSKEVKERAKTILNSVRLYFEAFEEDKPNNPLCSLFSDVIYNTKTAAKGDLKIHRLSRFSGSCRGGDEVILLCDKIQKENIKVRFYETDGSDKVIWENYGEFSPAADVHYQVAICFRTPPYRMNAEKEVFLCLERKDEMGDAIKFTYIPEETSKKRKYVSSFSCETSTSDSSPGSSESPMSEGVPSPECSSNDASEAVPLIKSEEKGVYLADLEMNDEYMNAVLDEVYKNNPTLYDNLDLMSPDGLIYPVENEVVGQMHDPGLFLFNPEAIETDGAVRSSMADLKLNDSLSSSLAFDGIDGNYKNSEYSKKQYISYKKFCLKRDKSGNTFLHLGILKNKDVKPILEMMEIAPHKIINFQNKKLQTALHLAIAESDDINLVENLLQHRSNPNIKDSEGNNCYHIAAEKNMHRIFNSRCLPELCAYNYEGLTPLHIAVMKNSECFFDRAKMFDIDFNIREGKAGKSLLHYAAQCQPSFTAKLLDLESIDVNIQDFEGNTPLHIACAYENISVVKLLLEAGANPLVTNFKENLNENCEDSAIDGLLPADMTTNIEILTLLEKATETKPGIPLNFPTCEPEPVTAADEIVEKLCDILDRDMKWKALAPYFVDEKYFKSLEISGSPTRALLSYIKKECQGNHLETFKSALEIVGFSDALQLIELNCF